MCADSDTEERWVRFQHILTEKLGRPPSLNDILLFVGTREAGLPPKQFSDTEKVNLVQMAVCTILVPARYYELYWVEDSGWPHYNQLQRLPEMTEDEKVVFLKPYLLLWAEKNKILK